MSNDATIPEIHTARYIFVEDLPASGLNDRLREYHSALANRDEVVNTLRAINNPKDNEVLEVLSNLPEGVMIYFG